MLLAICTVSWITSPPVDAEECCPNIENFVRSLMFLGSLRTNGRVFTVESCYSSIDGRGPHRFVGGGVVIVPENTSDYTWQPMIDDLLHHSKDSLGLGLFETKLAS